jgi:putative peptide zinc metalloprotease protein
MKAARVYITLGILAALLIAFFLLPLPVSRVHETGLIAVDPDALEGVMLPEPGRLKALSDVGPGQAVQRGQSLAEFKSEALEVKLSRALAELAEQESTATAMNDAALNAHNMGDSTAEQRFQYEFAKVRSKADTARDEVDRLMARKERLSELRAPRSGVLVTFPNRDEIGKLFDKGYTDQTPLFAVGDPGRLIVKVPVTPPNFRVLHEDLDRRGELDVSIYAKGRSDRTFSGKLRRLPAQNAATVPLPLTQRGGGSLAVKPNDDPNLLVPLAQVYLVEVELTDPDVALTPGQLAVVKIHARWRSGAWWVARALSNAMDLGLY